MKRFANMQIINHMENSTRVSNFGMQLKKNIQFARDQ